MVGIWQYEQIARKAVILLLLLVIAPVAFAQSALPPLPNALPLTPEEAKSLLELQAKEQESVAEAKEYIENGTSSSLKKEAVPTSMLDYDHFGLSLFYSERDIQRLKAALSFLGKSKEPSKPEQPPTLQEDDPFPADVTEAPKMMRLQEYPVFHLSSIAHQGAGKWVLWLNGKRTHAKNLPQGLTPLSVQSDQVRFKWTPEAYPVLASRWESIKQNDTQTAPKHLRSIKSQVFVNDSERSVTFVLRPNQSYASAFNQVVEGKAKPVPTVGDEGEVDITAFERALREKTTEQAATSGIVHGGGVGQVVRVVRPGEVNTGVGFVPSTIEQVTSIFPGGVPQSTTANGLPLPPQVVGNFAYPYPQAVGVGGYPAPPVALTQGQAVFAAPLPHAAQGNSGVVAPPQAVVPPAPASNTLGLPILPQGN